MKRILTYAAGGLVGALALGMAAIVPANAASLPAGKALTSTIDASGAVTLIHDSRHHHHRGNNHYRGQNYYDGWHQSNWHRRHYNQNRNYNYGPRYHHRSHGNVRPFKNFIRALAGYGYHNFHRPKFHGHGRNWTPHYFVSAYDGYGRGVNLRVCAYTGNVLGWRYH